MSDGFKVSKDLTLPRELLAWVITFIAKRNAGKTYNAAVLIEEILGARIPVHVIDGMGVWWGLRTGVDKEGRPDPSKPGLPIVIIGGKHADINLDPSKVGKIVEALLQTNTSAVLDISQFRKGQQMQIATTFAEEYYRLSDVYPAERVLAAEEADMFAPQRPFKEEARCLGAFEDLVKRGGNRNICFIEITQRSGDFNKNLLTQSDLLVVGRTTAPQDKEAIQAWVEKHSEKDKKEVNAWYDSLSHLGKGEVWVWNDDDEYPIFKKVQFRKRQTFHATRKFILTKQAHDIKLSDPTEFIDKFKDKFEPKPKVIEPRKPEITFIPIEKGVKVLPRLQAAFPEGPPPVRMLETPAANPTSIIRQSYPTLQIQREIAILPIPMSLQEPQTALGRLAVGLSSSQGPGKRDDMWTIKAMKETITNHSWPQDGVDEAISQFIEWDILRKLPSKAYRFNRDRVKLIDLPVTVEVA